MRCSLMSTAVIASLAWALPATAQSSGFYINGYAGADFSYFPGQPSARSTFVDMTLGIAPAATDSFGGIGFELGVVGFTFDNGMGSQSQHFFSGGVTFQIGGGRLLVGVPRSVALDFNPAILPSDSTMVRIVGIGSGLYPFSQFLSDLVNRPFYGLRYDRSSGDTDYAFVASVLDAGFARINTISGGVRHDFGSTEVFGRFEHLSTSGAPSIGMIQVGGNVDLTTPVSSLGAVEVGGFVGYSDNGTIAGMNAGLYATAHPMDRLSVSASILRLEAGLVQTLYGVNATYDVWNGVAVNAGYSRTVEGGASIWTLGLQRRF